MRLRRSKAPTGEKGGSDDSTDHSLGARVNAALTPSNAKPAIALGKVLVPVVLPFALRAATVARGVWDERQARRLGVAPGELKNYSGKGGALQARIAGITTALRELNAAHGERSAQVSAFAAATEPRLADLSAAVHAAEFMPTERRRAAHRAVSTELDRIEPELLDLLGVHSNP